MVHACVAIPNISFRSDFFADTYSAYAFGGTELVGVPITERKNPRTAMAGAVRLTFLRIFSIFILSIFLLGMTVPHNTPKLAFASSSHATAAASPFVAAVELANIKGLDHVINALMLLFITATSTTGLSRPVLLKNPFLTRS